MIADSLGEAVIITAVCQRNSRRVKAMVIVSCKAYYSVGAKLKGGLGRGSLTAESGSAILFELTS